MLHNLMDFNPLDILAAAALGEKDAPSDVKTTKGSQTSSTGPTENSETTDSKDADEDSNEEMGKTTSNNLKHNHSAKDTEKMAPQKMPWSPETLLPGHLDGIASKQQKFSLDDLVQDIKKKGFNVQLQKIIDKNITTDMFTKEQFDDNISSPELTLNNNLVTNNNAINNLPGVESASQTPDPTSDNENAKEHATRVSTELQPDYVWRDETVSNPSEDTMDSSDSKLQDQTEPISDFYRNESIILDHPYALTPGKTYPPAIFEDDDDIDVCSDNSPLSEDSEQRSHNLSLDCNYLKFGIMEGVSASTQDLYRMSRSAISHFKLPSSSASSPTADLVYRPSHSFSSSDETGDIFTGVSSPVPLSYDPFSVSSPQKAGLKYGKFKIGTFASFSSSNLELEKFLKSRQHTDSKKLNIGIPTDAQFISPSLNSPSTYSNLYPLLQSPSLDWDRSEAGSETQDDSSEARTPLRMSPDFTEQVTEWSHPVFHDHDYCAKNVEPVRFVDDFRKFSNGKRKYTKKKNKLDGVNHEKIMKAKYLKKELLRQDNFMKSSSDLEPLCADPAVIKTNPVGRPRKRPFDKIIDEEIDPEIGSKLKITGKFQDQYVYYLSKSSRTTTRRRQVPGPHFTSDKILVPAPKPGDIVVPHLTDADIETVRLKGRGALNLPDRPHMTNHLPMQSVIHNSSHNSEFISDVDSHIVSTILSMENDSLASPTTSQASDITNTAGLNPHQPELTESLRLMSGDPSITSEHVLNYLLSVVKDDGLLGGGSGFDTSNSSLFPSLQSDVIYTKSDHTGDPVCVSHQYLSSLDNTGSPNLCSGHDLLDITKSAQSTCSFDNHTVLSSSHIHGPHHFVHTVHKDSLDENVSLSDDLSSFMSNSQGTSSSNTTQDGDSHSSLKSMFGSDLSSLGTPQLSSSVPRLTSIEKTLDYLGVRDEDIKLDDNVFNTKLDHDTDSIQALTPVSSTSSDDTPWIVTVTLYFNDVPAIMINNQPYIRLVDIHKQILPAKDTGILKKRCQLLKIPVLNCTEMQRYFLVQYGRAYNSKSTLIVSKEQATHLVTYYAIPQPRLGRADESHQHRPSSSCGSEGETRSPVANIPSGSSKRRLAKTYRKTSTSLGSPESEAVGVSLSHIPHQDTAQKHELVASSQGKRTRHKKVNYLEMLKGEEKEKSSSAAILETIESVVRSALDYIHEGRSNKTPLKKKLKDDQTVNAKSGGTRKKLTATLQKKNIDKGSKGKKDLLGITQRTKGNKAKSLIIAKLGKDIDICSEIDSDNSLDISQAKKFRPLKLKVNSLLNFAGQRKGPSSSKKGLFSCTNSSSPPDTERPLRVLAVAHQAALSGTITESHLPSQPADIHLDLFLKSNSACVRCETCSQFLSVPHFMRHHHVPMDNEWLATEAAHRILVPRNKENISEQEKRLWEEFHHLQEAIGGFGEADDETDSDECDDGYSDDDDQISLKLSGSLSNMLSVARSPLCTETQVKGLQVSQMSSVCENHSLAPGDNGSYDYLSPDPLSVIPNQEPQKHSLDAMATLGLTQQFNSHKSVVSNTRLLSRVTSPSTGSIVRTSSRKRKSKQLFSIENYYTPHRSLVDEDLCSHKDSSDV